MKALLYSWAGSPNAQLIFESHFDFKYKKQRIAYVPNAKDGDDIEFTQRETKRSIARIANNVKSVTKFDLYQMADTWSVDYMVDNFDTVYVGGGMMGPLLKAVKETGFDTLLNDLAQTDIKYVGSSAGSMLTSQTMKVAGWYPNEEEPEMVDKTGLGWLPFEMFPHYDELKHKDLIQEKATDPLVLLPDNSAIGIEGGELRFYNQARLLL